MSKTEIEQLRAENKQLRIKLEKAQQSKKRKSYTEDFEKFWRNFKGRWNPDTGYYVKVGKYLAFGEWRKLTKTEQQKAIAVAHKVGGKYVPDACRWLKRRLFDDFKG